STTSRSPGVLLRTVGWTMLLLLTAFRAPMAAQSGSGVAAIEGIVTDPTDRAVPGALVVIVSSETGYERFVYTDARGRYFASAMPVSTYLVGASASGLASVERR